ncbi:MAG: type II secretion system F family protein [Clostridia bacterium]|nr:type II secretion system F family protein [Clostridia bacterium]
MLNLIVVAAFISAFLLFYSILKIVIGKQKSIGRLRRYLSIEEIREEKRKPAKKEFKAGLGMIAKGVGNAKFLDGYKRSIQHKLTRAHVLLKAEEFITIGIVLFLVFSFISFALSKSLPIAALIGVFGWIVPGTILKVKIKRRIKYLNEQLCDAIVLISNSLKAGYSFFQSVDIVAKDMHGPIAEEFAMLQKEMNLGVSTEKALENLVNRVRSDDLELVVTAVMIQRQVGGNLAEIMDNISSTIRERIKIKGEVRTVTAQGRVSGIIISLLPPGLGVILFFINPEHIGLLFKDIIGIGILVFSVFMELIGIYFINKVVKIDI